MRYPCKTEVQTQGQAHVSYVIEKRKVSARNKLGECARAREPDGSVRNRGIRNDLAGADWWRSIRRIDRSCERRATPQGGRAWRSCCRAANPDICARGFRS